MRRSLAVLLAVQLGLPLWSQAQVVASPPGPATQQGSEPAKPAQLPDGPMVRDSLRIFVLEGQGSINSTEQGLATAPVIEVRDHDDHPVEAASVTFRLPPSGPGGSFQGGQMAKTVITNVQGQATANQFTPNGLTGKFNIHVTVTAGARMGEADIAQTNSVHEFKPSKDAPHKRKSLISRKWLIIGGAGAAAVVAIILLTGGSSGPPTVTITAGPPVVGGR